MKKVISQGAFLLFFVVVLIICLAGCGSGGYNGSTGFLGTEHSGASNGKALDPNVFSTPSNPIFAPGVNHTSSSPTKTLKTSSIPLPAGSTITIKSFSGDAAVSSMFGYYDPVTGTEEVLTADCLASVQAGEVFGPFGPYENDVTMVFWFYSTWTGSPGKIMIESVDSATYNIGCEDWDDDDYNDYIAQVTIEPPSKISIKNAKATPEKFNPSFNPPDNQSIISASIVAKEGFSAETISWNVVINNNNGLVKSFPDRTGSPGVGPWNVSEVWDGKNDSGVFAGAGEYTFKITATATANGETVQKSASGKVIIVDNKLKIIDASIVPSNTSPGQTIILNYKVVTYPENWEPRLRSCYYILNSSNDILVTADLQPTSYGCVAEYKDVPVTIPASAEAGVYKVQITAWTYAVIDSNGRPLAAEPVELALNIGTVSTQKKLKISNLKVVPLKRNGTEISDYVYPPNDPDLYPVGGEKLKFTGNIETTPSGLDSSFLNWRIWIKDVSTGKYVGDSGLNPGSDINFIWEEPFEQYFHTGGLVNGIMDDISNPRLYRYFIQACCTYPGIEPIQQEVVGQSIGFEIPVEMMYGNDPSHPEQWSDPSNPQSDNNFQAGDHNRPLPEYDCLTACYAMILNKYNIPATPISINTFLLKLQKEEGRQAFDKFQNADFYCVFIDYALMKTWGKAFFLPVDILNDIDAKMQFEKNNPTIIGINTNMPLDHAVVGKGYCRTVDNYRNYRINDPNYHNTPVMTIDDIPRAAGVTPKIVEHVAAVPFLNATDYLGSISLLAYTFTNFDKQNNFEYSEHPLVELCITDPSGKKLGYVDSNKGVGNIIRGIPNSCYGIHSRMSFEQGDVPYSSCRSVDINNPTSGNFSVQIIGIQSCGYLLDISIRDKFFGVKDLEGVTGIISPGTTHTCQITFNSSDAKAYKFTKTILSGDIGKSLQTAFDLNWIDNRGILNSLAKKLENAEAAYSRGKITTAVNELNAYINEVNAQKGKHIKSKAADMLIYDAKAYIKCNSQDLI